MKKWLPSALLLVASVLLTSCASAGQSASNEPLVTTTTSIKTTIPKPDKVGQTVHYDLLSADGKLERASQLQLTLFTDTANITVDTVSELAMTAKNDAARSKAIRFFDSQMVEGSYRVVQANWQIQNKSKAPIRTYDLKNVELQYNGKTLVLAGGKSITAIPVNGTEEFVSFGLIYTDKPKAQNEIFINTNIAGLKNTAIPDISSGGMTFTYPN